MISRRGLIGSLLGGLAAPLAMLVKPKAPSPEAPPVAGEDPIRWDGCRIRNCTFENCTFTSVDPEVDTGVVLWSITWVSSDAGADVVMAGAEEVKSQRRDVLASHHRAFLVRGGQNIRPEVRAPKGCSVGQYVVSNICIKVIPVV